MELLRAHARSAGSLPAGKFRAVVLESDGRLTVRDFEDLEAAKGYVDDAASEYGDTPPTALVVDHRFEIVRRGRAYYEGEG